MPDIDEEASIGGTMVSDQGRIGRLKKPTMEKTLWKAKLALAAACSSCMFVLMIVVTVTIDAREATKFSVELTDFKGLNATVGPTVSPVFSLKVHANNPRVLKPLCYSDGKVTSLLLQCCSCMGSCTALLR